MNWNSTAPSPRPRLGTEHGYVVDGDMARLHADVECLEDLPPAGRWALQLWACDAPHDGGPLSGIKVAEAALDRTHGNGARRLDASAQALVPGGQRDYSMVLVLATGDNGRFDQVLDFANYPSRQSFVTPHFDGCVGYSIDDAQVVLEAGAIRNPRADDNLSGTLSLELWALTHAYRGGSFEGHVLGRVDLGRLAGQRALEGVVERARFTAPPAGTWELVLMLREWAGAPGYITRDYARFPVAYVVEDAATAIVEAVPPVHVAASAPPAVVEASHTQPAGPGGISINSATVKELATIKGMSAKLAAEIVKGRPYKSLEELLDVRGVGVKVLARLRPFLRLD